MFKGAKASNCGALAFKIQCAAEVYTQRCTLVLLFGASNKVFLAVVVWANRLLRVHLRVHLCGSSKSANMERTCSCTPPRMHYVSGRACLLRRPYVLCSPPRPWQVAICLLLRICGRLTAASSSRFDSIWKSGSSRWIFAIVLGHWIWRSCSPPRRYVLDS